MHLGSGWGEFAGLPLVDHRFGPAESHVDFWSVQVGEVEGCGDPGRIGCAEWACSHRPSSSSSVRNLAQGAQSQSSFALLWVQSTEPTER